jgi:perosamine synthetase
VLKPIPVNTPALSAEEHEAVLQCLQDGWISSEGPQVGHFEALFAKNFGREHGVAVSNGTAGLDIAVRALGISAGDEILVPSLTIISCASAIVNSGARPVPVDCDPTDWNSHLRHFQSRITPRTRAIMLVHLYGLCGDLAPLLAWAREQNLAVIEDASQAHGLTCQGSPCGSFGDISVFSLYANKVVTTGEGGVILCNDAALAQRCRSLRNLCFIPERRFWHEELGWNYRLTAMQAALGIPQLRRLPQLVRRKRAIGRAYFEAFRGVPQFQVAPAATPYCENVWWVFGLVVSPEAGFSRADIVAALGALGIGTRPFFHGLHEQPVLLRHGMASDSLPVTEALSAGGFYLPSGLGLPDEDQRRVISAVLDFVRERS